jgi:hypothetical protein
MVTAVKTSNLTQMGITLVEFFIVASVAGVNFVDWFMTPHFTVIGELLAVRHMQILPLNQYV